MAIIISTNFAHDFLCNHVVKWWMFIMKLYKTLKSLLTVTMVCFERSLFLPTLCQAKSPMDRTINPFDYSNQEVAS